MTAKSSSYDRLVSLIKDRHDGSISDQEAHRLARNLMGYCELVIQVGLKRPQKNLDNQLECNNLFTQRSSADAELIDSPHQSNGRESSE
jgi:hypothetical protein